MAAQSNRMQQERAAAIIKDVADATEYTKQLQVVMQLDTSNPRALPMKEEDTIKKCCCRQERKRSECCKGW